MARLHQICANHPRDPNIVLEAFTSCVYIIDILNYFHNYD